MQDQLQLIINKLDSIRRSSETDTEYWFAREMQSVLGYDKWDNFLKVIQKARESCVSMNVDPSDHFLDTGKMVGIGSGARRVKADFILSRYACYLMAMNGDPSKQPIAAAQQYFAIQTRRQELTDQKTEKENRLEMRRKVKDANKNLSNAAKDSGVINYAAFHDAGYRGLYNMSLKEICGLKDIGDDDLLDRAGHAELAANYFRITQTEQKLTNEKIKGEKEATNTHYQVGTTVRETIKRISGTMPEDLPPEPSIKKLEKEQKKKALLKT